LQEVTDPLEQTIDARPILCAGLDHSSNTLLVHHFIDERLAVCACQIASIC
jgi:hypothetical protein